MRTFRSVIFIQLLATTAIGGMVTYDSYCYTMEIGTAFHQQPEDVNHNLKFEALVFLSTSSRWLPVMRKQTNLLVLISQQNFLVLPSNVDVPASGIFPI